MAKTATVTWLGDEDPNAQIIHMGDLRFIRGEAVKVDAEHGYMQMIRGNPLFAVDEKAEVTEIDDEEAEKTALKEQLATVGVTMRGNPSVDTLRSKLAEATK